MGRRIKLQLTFFVSAALHTVLKSSLVTSLLELENSEKKNFHLPLSLSVLTKKKKKKLAFVDQQPPSYLRAMKDRKFSFWGCEKVCFYFRKSSVLHLTYLSLQAFCNLFLVNDVCILEFTKGF